MRIVLVSRFPRVDVVGWKRSLASALEEDGHELAILYSRSSPRDHAHELLAQAGSGIFARFRRARSAPAPDAAAAPTERRGSLAGWAEDRGYPVLRHDRLGDPAAVDALRRLRPDLLLLAGADIAPRALLDVPGQGTLNAHYGILPRYRGMNAAEWSVYHDDPVGVTVHFVDPGIDTGDLAERVALEVEGPTTLDAIRARQQALAIELLHAAVRRVAAGDVRRVAQSAGDGRQYYRMHPEIREKVVSKLAAGRYRSEAIPGLG